jgi:hypothetical protein
MTEPSKEAWMQWARSPETLAFLRGLEKRDNELCTAAKQAAKVGKTTQDFLLRAGVFEEIAQEIRHKLTV